MKGFLVVAVALVLVSFLSVGTGAVAAADGPTDQGDGLGITPVVSEPRNSGGITTPGLYASWKYGRRNPNFMPVGIGMDVSSFRMTLPASYVRKAYLEFLGPDEHGQFQAVIVVAGKKRSGMPEVQHFKDSQSDNGMTAFFSMSAVPCLPVNGPVSGKGEIKSAVVGSLDFTGAGKVLISGYNLRYEEPDKMTWVATIDITGEFAPWISIPEPIPDPVPVK